MLIGYFLSVVIGFTLGIFGGGGSILTVPVLVYIFHIPPVMATAYSLFIVGATSFVGAIPKYREHLINLKTGIQFGIPSIIAIFSTRKWIVPAIPEIVFEAGFVLTKRELLLGLFALLMVIASISMIRTKKKIASKSKHFSPPLIIIEGLLIGFLTGLVGAGGGFLIIPALVFLTGLPFKTAVGTSLLIIAINSLIGFLGDLLNYEIEWRFLLSITALAIIGIIAGNFLSRRILSQHLRKAFGWVTLLMGCWILLKEFILN